MKKKSENKIVLSPELSLPMTIGTQKSALLGGNGSGKTYAATLVEEQYVYGGGWLVVIDPVGIHYGLRLDASGKGPSGLDIPVFGGLYGDLPLVPESGKLVADLLCDRRLSAVLDVSQFSSGELNRFATDFGNQFYARMKARKRAVLVVLEEAQEIIPQNPMKGEEQKLGIWQRIAKIGRNYGIGIMMISQRPQDIHKKVFNLTQLMLAFQMTGTHERKAMQDWADYINFDKKFSNILPELEVGKPYVLSPRWLKYEGIVQVNQKHTYDASATPDFEEDADTISLAPIDITELTKTMESLIVKVKENDPVELKRRISKLEKELKKLEQEHTHILTLPETIPPDPEIIEVPVFNQLDNERMQYFSEMLEQMHETSVDVLKWQKDLFDRLGQFQKNGKRSDRIVVPAMAVSRVKGTSVPEKFYKENKVVSVSTALVEGLELDGPMQRILNALGWFYSIGITAPLKTAVAFLANYSPRGGAFSNPLGRLNKLGLIQYVSGGALQLTNFGTQYASRPADPLTTDAMIEHIMSVLPGPEAAILKSIIEFWPNAVSKEQVAEQTLSSRGTPYSPEGGAFANPLGRLKTLGLITYPQSGWVRASDFIFVDEN